MRKLEKIYKKIYKKLEEEKIDALLVNSDSNFSYLTDSEYIDSYLILTSSKNYLVTDKRFKFEAQYFSEKGWQVVINSNYFSSIEEIIRKEKIKYLGFEEKDVSFKEYQILKERVKVLKSVDVLEGIRKIKTPQEIRRIKQTIKITSEIIELVKEMLTPGITEKRLYADINKFALLRGAQSLAFEPIICFGENSAFPHAKPSFRRLSLNQMVLVDIGVKFKNYCSDLTRVFYIGRIPKSFRRDFELVLEAQRIAISLIKDGVEVAFIERKVREFFKKNKRISNVLHSVGHGIGIDVHEPPFLSIKSREILRENMVITIEPGIYFKNKYGIRIEDVVQVKKHKGEVLSEYIHKSI